MCNALVLKYKYVDRIRLKFIRTVYLKERINLPPILACVNNDTNSSPVKVFMVRKRTTERIKFLGLEMKQIWFMEVHDTTALFCFCSKFSLKTTTTTTTSSNELEHTNTSLFSYIHILVLEKGRKGGIAN